MLKTSQHPSASVLNDYVQGRLNDEESRQIEEHLANCDQCCDALDQIGSGTIEALFRSAEHLPKTEADVGLATGPNDTKLKIDSPAESRYDLQQKIGSGGMGVVYEAWDRQLQRSVAIKTLHVEKASSSLRNRFVREALITARLNHPSVPSTHELGTLTDGRPFIAMKLVRGKTLAVHLAEDRQNQLTGMHDRTALLSTFGRLCECVAFAHSCGIIHRDIKPSNVMVGEFGEVQLMDWGLAKDIVDRPLPAEAARKELQPHIRPQLSQHAASDASNERTTEVPTHGPGDTDSLLSESDASLAPAVAVETPCGFGSTHEEHTLDGTVLGTLGYMAPEQARGEHSTESPRTDVFSLGAVLCEILTGKPPFTRDDTTLLAQDVALGDLSEFDHRMKSCTADVTLVQLMRDCLAAEPADRPADAQAVATRIAAWKSDVNARLEEARVAQARSETQVQEERKRRRLQLAILLSATLFAVTVWQLQSMNERQQASFAAQENRRHWTLHQTAVTDLDAFDASLETATQTLFKAKTHWAEARLHLDRASEAAAKLEHSELSKRVEESELEFQTAREESRADTKLLRSLDDVSFGRTRRRPQPGPPRASESAGQERRPPRPLRLDPNPNPPSTHNVAERTHGASSKFDSVTRAIRAYGFDPTSDSVDELVAHLRTRPANFRTELQKLVEVWFHYAIVGRRDERFWMMELANQLDENEYREKLRTAMLNHDRTFLRTEALRPDFLQQPPEIIWSTASFLRRDLPGGVSEFFALAHLAHPDNPVISWDLAVSLVHSDRKDQAIQLLITRATQQADPVRQARAWIQVAELLNDDGAERKRVLALRRAIELDPPSFPERQFVDALRQADDPEFTIDTLTQLLATKTLRESSSVIALADAYFADEEWTNARTRYQNSVSDELPADTQQWLKERIALCDMMLGEL